MDGIASESILLLCLFCFCLGLAFGRFINKSKRNSKPSSNGAISPKQKALIDAMIAEGLLSDFEIKALSSNQTARFASQIISNHIDAHNGFLAQKKTEKRNPQNADEEKRKSWLDLDDLPPAELFPIKERKFLFTKRELVFYRMLALKFSGNALGSFMNGCFAITSASRTRFVAKIMKTSFIWNIDVLAYCYQRVTTFCAM